MGDILRDWNDVTFYALSAIWCYFLCLSARDVAFYAYQLWKNIEIEFTHKDFFQQYGLSSWIFCPCKNTQWYLLDLSVLFVEYVGQMQIEVWGNSI